MELTKTNANNKRIGIQKIYIFVLKKNITAMLLL